ncbi:MAG: hypothetical protein P8100_14025 [bacterium]|jgi:hypothetical protein
MKLKKEFLAAMILCLVLSAFDLPETGLTNESSTGDTTEFVCVRSEEDINLYTRWIPVTKERSVRQIMVSFTVNAGREEVIDILSDESLYLQWMKSAKQYYRIRTVNENSWYAYIQFSIPWPLKNQDCILKYEVLPPSDAAINVIQVSSVPEYMADQKGVERISHMELTWVITEIAPDQTFIQYYAFSNQPPKFPTWITDPIIQKNTIKTMSALQDICQAVNLKYASS